MRVELVQKKVVSGQWIETALPASSANYAGTSQAVRCCAARPEVIALPSKQTQTDTDRQECPCYSLRLMRTFALQPSAGFDNDNGSDIDPVPDRLPTAYCPLITLLPIARFAGLGLPGYSSKFQRALMLCAISTLSMIPENFSAPGPYE